MPNLNRSARKVLTEQMDPYVDGFDSMVADVIHDTFADDPQLRRLASVLAETKYAADRYGNPADTTEESEALAEARENVHWVLERRTREVVAMKCETVALDAPEWTDAHSEKKIEVAVREAVEWLNANTNAAERADVAYGETLPDVDELFVDQGVAADV